MSFVCAALDGVTCTSWVALDVVASDWDSIGVTSTSLFEAFVWGFGAVSAFYVLGWTLRIGRTLLEQAFNYEKGD